jgi:short chain dehydrogenase
VFTREIINVNCTGNGNVNGTGNGNGNGNGNVPTDRHVFWCCHLIPFVFCSFRCDVSKKDEVSAVAKKVQEAVGDVSILINNAGIMPCQPFLDHSEVEIRRIFDINVLAHFWVNTQSTMIGVPCSNWAYSKLAWIDPWTRFQKAIY